MLMKTTVCDLIYSMEYGQLTTRTRTTAASFDNTNFEEVSMSLSVIMLLIPCPLDFELLCVGTATCILQRRICLRVQKKTNFETIDIIL